MPPRSRLSFEKFVKADHVGAILLDAHDEPPWAGIFGTVGLVGRITGGVVVYPTNGCSTCRAPNRRSGAVVP